MMSMMPVRGLQSGLKTILAPLVVGNLFFLTLKDREYNGIAIKLSDGVLNGWDGRLIKHGTSMVGSRVGNIYGTFFAAKTRIIKYGMSQLTKEQCYSYRM